MGEIKGIDERLYQEIVVTDIFYISEFRGKSYARWSRGRFCLRDWVIGNNNSAVEFWIVAFFFQLKSIKKIGEYNYILDGEVSSVLTGLDEAIDWFRTNGFPEEWIKMLEDVWYDKKGLAEKK
ncbi:hypothetical protein MLD52_22085 [Puniceicoccaceae bacterium K14]|nr:hypothetical protein [Puniceicoccaceae bacterium K14]